jgi:hypothetical protein
LNESYHTTLFCSNRYPRVWYDIFTETSTVIDSSSNEKKVRCWEQIIVKLREKGKNLNHWETDARIIRRQNNGIQFTGNHKSNKVSNSRYKKNMCKWDLAENDKYQCGEVQDERQVYKYPNLNAEYTWKCIEGTNNNAIQLAEYWNGKL